MLVPTMSLNPPEKGVTRSKGGVRMPMLVACCLLKDCLPPPSHVSYGLGGLRIPELGIICAIPNSDAIAHGVCTSLGVRQPL
jgi:hypothetical protein